MPSGYTEKELGEIIGSTKTELESIKSDIKEIKVSQKNTKEMMDTHLDIMRNVVNDCNENHCGVEAKTNKRLDKIETKMDWFTRLMAASGTIAAAILAKLFGVDIK